MFGEEWWNEYFKVTDWQYILPVIPKWECWRLILIGVARQCVVWNCSANQLCVSRSTHYWSKLLRYLEKYTMNNLFPTSAFQYHIMITSIENNGKTKYEVQSPQIKSQKMNIIPED